MTHEQNLDLAISTHRGAIATSLIEQVQQLARAAQAQDGNPPLSDQTLIELAQAGQQLIGIYAFTDGDQAQQLAGTAIALRAGDQEPWTVELVVDPKYRRRMVATRILQQLRDALGEAAAVQAWAHGDHPGAQALAAQHGLVRWRDLYKMRRQSAERLPVGQLPEGLTLRTFTPGEDEQALLATNAAAFAEHPEQGSLSEADLRARYAEPWFDPEGFFLAVDQRGQVQAFHWTKLPPRETGDSELVGEVYVVGVLPTAQGLGLGRILTAVGINHLLERGVDAVMLYVDAENTPAVNLYKALDFTVSDVDVMYGAAR